MSKKIISFIALGSNVGNRKKNLLDAISMILEKCKIIKQSSIYETKPVGYIGQDDFLNMVIKIETEFTIYGLFVFLQAIEKKLGKDIKFKNGPRTIDLDVLFYGDEIINEENIIIPHPRLHERLFVLDPLCEIDKNFMHPVLEKKICELMACLV